MTDLGVRRETIRFGFAGWADSRAAYRAAAAVVIAAVMSLGALVGNGNAAVPGNGRAWEMVSFVQPSSARTFGVRPMGGSGDSFIYSTAGPPPGSSSGAFLNYTAAVRSPTGWAITPVGFPYLIFSGEIFADVIPLYPVAFSEDLRTAVWISSVQLTPDGPPEGQLGLYRKVMGETPQFIAKVGTGFALLYSSFADIAGDGGRVVFATEEHLLPEDAGRTQGESIYEWNGGPLQLVDVDNSGALLSTCGPRISRANGMSASATQVFFTVPAACGGVEKVYLRDLDAGTTTEISASRCTRVDCNAPQAVTFAGATHDGRIAFLTSAQQLTDDDHDASPDLYRYDVITNTLSLLSGGSSAASGEVLQGPVYPSDDGVRIYFRAYGELTPGEAPAGEKLFVAGPSGLDLVAVAAQPVVEPSANGKRVLFTTQTKVLDDDTDSEADAYLYDADQKAITRISTGLGGGDGPFEVHIDSPIARSEFELGNHRQFYSLDSGGERAVFWTPEQLLPEDVNSKVDIYEWWNGQLGLVSPAKEETHSAFGGMSRDGRTVVFATSSALSPADQDGGNRDFYAARLGGGFPEAPRETPGCDISSCPFPTRQQLSRPALRSTSALRRKRRNIRLLGIRSQQDGAIGRSTVVSASVPSPGLVSALVWTRGGGKKAVLATGSAGAIRPGRIRLALSLTRFGRRAGVGITRGLLTVKEGDSQASQIVKVDLSR